MKDAERLNVGRIPNSMLGLAAGGYSTTVYGIINRRIETDAEADANARLFGAARLLLAACRAFVDECGGDPPDWLAAEHDQALDAIAAAACGATPERSIR